MMASKAETAILALVAAMQGLGATVKRNDDLGAVVNAGANTGLIVVHDGKPGEPEIDLSPVVYNWRHEALIEVFAQSVVPDAVLDTLKVAIGQSLAADRTLGGAVDWVEWAGAETDFVPVDGAVPIKSASIIVVLHYTSTNPLN
jgi:hypothetical protein